MLRCQAGLMGLEMVERREDFNIDTIIRFDK